MQLGYRGDMLKARTCTCEVPVQILRQLIPSLVPGSLGVDEQYQGRQGFNVLQVPQQVLAGQTSQ
jgi:hypothetical protein